MGETLPDGVFLHAGQPQAENGLFTARLPVDQAEDQFSLAPCVATVHDAIHIRAVHQLLQDAELLFGAGRHQILPPFRQDGQICDTPLDVFGIVDVGRCQFHQVPHAPAHQIAVAFKVAVLTAGGTEDFGVGHGNGRFFRHDQFCDKNPSNLFWIAICKAANAANRIILLPYPPRRSPPAHPRWESQNRPCPRCSLHRGQGLLFLPAFSASAS